MPQAKSKNAVGLGNTLMNDRFGRGKGQDRRKGPAITRTNHTTGEQYITNTKEEASWVKMRSVTEQGALDEFLATAELAGTDFTAEKMSNVKIIHSDQRNPYLLSAADERSILGKHRDHKSSLTVPRRPHWDASTTPEKLDELERESFLNWRRGLAELQENNDLLMTPFERNLEVWRQLWRVIERSDVVVQIVDARNPLLFRSEDLETYVKAVDSRKQNLLLINKADMMTYKQRKAWADYLKGAKIAYKFFSASLAKEVNESRDFEDELSDDDEENVEDPPDERKGERMDLDGAEGDERCDEDDEEDDDDDDDGDSDDINGAYEPEEDDDTKILTVDELESIFLQYSPEGSQESDRKLEVGLVGYPNVGKSSTINALIGAKKVSVSATPGKTKHFQTIHLSDRVILCDCPGLVFPNFASTKAELVCNGILPIDQLREYTGPAGLVARRIPQPFLEAIYGIHIRTRPLEEGGTGVPTAEELLVAYARARGFTKTGQGQPNESRAARYILKDYVSGKLLYCEPPPGSMDAAEFNSELYDLNHLPAKRRLALLAAMEAASPDSEIRSTATLVSDIAVPVTGAKSRKLDKAFFKTSAGNSGHVTMPFNYKYSEQGRSAGKQLSGRKARAMVALQTGLDPKEVRLMGGKKHFKGGQRNKGKGRGDKMEDEAGP